MPAMSYQSPSPKSYSRRFFFKQAAVAGLTASVLPTWAETSSATGFLEGLSSVVGRENQNVGSRDWQLSNPATNKEITGYASRATIQHGQTLNLMVQCETSHFRLEFFRIGWYQGLGGRRMQVHGIEKPLVLSRSAPTTDAGKHVELFEDGHFPAFTLWIPNDWTSGVYVAKLTTSSSGAGKQVFLPFVLRDDRRPARMLMQSGIESFHASGAKMGSTVSLNGPGLNPEFLTQEFESIREMEKSGLDLTYCSSSDLHTSPQFLQKYKGLLVSSTNVAWSAETLAEVQKARQRGADIIFLSPDPRLSQVKYASDRKGRQNRCLIHCSPSTQFLAARSWVGKRDGKTMAGIFPLRTPSTRMLG
jgi:hypothetical protein